MASHAQEYFRARNGGVHRGGIMGENWLDLPMVADTEVGDVAANNLLLFGSEQSNGVWKQLGKDLPVVLRDGSISW